jgi:hypothetical protein
MNRNELKATTQAFRKALKDAGVRCNVRMTPGRYNGIQVYTKVYGEEFSVEEQRTTRRLAVEFGFTHVRGLPIVVERDTDPFSHEFYC